MKKGEVFGVLLILIIITGGIVSALYISMWVDNRQDAKIIRAYSDIAILKDKDFTKTYNFTGSGTVDDPFLIENLHLNSSKSFGIIIKETTLHFVIRNCSIQKIGSGISISNIALNTAIIKECILNTSLGAISIRECHGVQIINNTCIGPNNPSNWFFSCNEYNTGIHLWVASFTKISNNNILGWDDGIWMNFADYTSLVNNNCSFNKCYGIYSQMTDYLFLSSNTCQNNTYGIYISSSRLYTAINNHLFNNVFGFYDSYSLGTNIIANNCSSNSVGIYFEGSGMVNITGNLCENNLVGMRIYGGRWINISRNNLMNNTHHGVNFYGTEYCFTYHNNFIGNNLIGSSFGNKQAYEDPENSIDNFWFDSSKGEGNFWSDLVWDETAVYYIDGSNNTDPYPLENPVVI